VSRLFRGLRDRPPRPRYDAVVVGAGVGGLVCANLLAAEGLAVLLVEQHYMVGGYCSTFRRGGFVFDASTHFYPLLGNPATLTGRLLADLGCRTRWIKMDPVDAFHFPDGSRFDVPADFDVYRARLAAEFPAEAAALDAFFAEVREAYLLGLLEYFRGRSTPQIERHRQATLRSVLDRHFRDPKLKLLLTADCPHWGSPPCRTSFVFDAMLRLSYFLGNYYPVGGSQAFADDLARCLEERGGEVLTSTRVDRIVVADGRAAGVEMETLRGPCRGRWRVAAEAVVSNADLLATLQGMLEPEQVPPATLAALRRLRPSYPCFLTHLGLRGVSAADLEPLQGYYWDSWDPDDVGRGGLRCKVFVPTLYEPAMAPPGGQVVILQKVLEMDWGEVTDWSAHRRAVEEFVLGHFERLLPGVGERIVVRASASARTAHRFTLNTAGAMLGWEMSPDQLGAGRPGILGPVDGLYFVGHWTRPGGGITPVMVSAQHVASAITGRGAVPAAPAEQAS
jgi:prolycopene isomerase